jgi:hypothetical protein
MIADEKPTTKDYALSRATLVTEIFKALLLINGGGAVALLTLLKDTRTPNLAVVAGYGCLWMSGGLMAAVLSAAFRFWQSIAAEEKPGTPTQKAFRVVYWGLMILSAFCFGVGAAYVGTGGLGALNCPSQT